MTELRKHNYNPVHEINAAVNRREAMRCSVAGLPPAAIAKHWPRVWKLTDTGQLEQIYDCIYANGRTDTRITMQGVTAYIATWKRARKSPRAKAEAVAD